MPFHHVVRLFVLNGAWISLWLTSQLTATGSQHKSKLEPNKQTKIFKYHQLAKSQDTSSN